MICTILTLIVLEALLFSGASAQGCGEIVIQPSNQNVSIGDMVDIQCLKETDSVITWLFERNGITNSVDRDSPRYDLNEDGKLTINNFDPSYAGLYRCVVDRCVSKPAKLLYFNTQGTFQTHPQDFVAYKGIGTAAFNCTFDESDYSIPPTISWQINGETVQSQDTIVIFNYRYTSFLQIHQPNLSMHMADIGCVESGANIPSEIATLQVISGDPPADVEPSFSTRPIRFMYLNKGDTVIAGCSSDEALDSIPLAWAFENTTEFLFTSFDLLVFDIPLSLYGHTNLLVDSSKYDFHNVTYLCQLLWNSGGLFFNAPVTFFVYNSPNITTSVPSDVITTQRGEQVAIPIEVNKNTPAMVKWFFDGTPLSSSADGRVVIANESNDEFDYGKVWTQDLDASLYFNNITCDDLGFYQVEISNPVETILFTYELDVENCVIIAPIQGNSNDDDSFPWWIILIILLLILILLLLLLLCCWCWRRRYVVYEAEKLETKYHKEYEIMRRGGSPVDTL